MAITRRTPDEIKAIAAIQLNFEYAPFDISGMTVSIAPSKRSIPAQNGIRGDIVVIQSILVILVPD